MEPRRAREVSEWIIREGYQASAQQPGEVVAELQSVDDDKRATFMKFCSTLARERDLLCERLEQSEEFIRIRFVAPMELNMSIAIDAKDADPEIAKRIDELVADEAPAFVERIRRRLASEGVTDLRINEHESE